MLLYYRDIIIKYRDLFSVKIFFHFNFPYFLVFYQAYSYRLINLTLVIFLGYFYNLGDIHSDILIEAILIKKACV